MEKGRHLATYAHRHVPRSRHCSRGYTFEKSISLGEDFSGNTVSGGLRFRNHRESGTKVPQNGEARDIHGSFDYSGRAIGRRIERWRNICQLRSQRPKSRAIDPRESRLTRAASPQLRPSRLLGFSATAVGENPPRAEKNISVVNRG